MNPAPDSSIWHARLDEFREKIASRDPSVAAVSVAAVSAACAVNLVVMVLEITMNRKNFSGDRRRAESLVDSALAESERLARYADEDPAAYARYMRCLRMPKNTPAEREQRDHAVAEALQRATEVPIAAARSAMAALNVCAEAAEIAHGSAATDLGGAAMLLAGSVRALLLSVDANLAALGESEFADEIAAECAELEERADRQSQAVRKRVTATE